MHWHFRAEAPADAATESPTFEQAAQQASVHQLAARILRNRGISTASALSAFLSDSLTNLPDPFLLKGMPDVVKRLHLAIVKQQSVTLYGDYDVDGVCSTALLKAFLSSVGLHVRTYIPHRLGEGYGLNGRAIDQLAQEGTQLLVTLDCGITSHAEIARANAAGVEVIVVDHHAVPKGHPPALPVLNPLQEGCAYPTKWLCAAGVTFNVLLALRKHLRDNGFFAERAEPNLKQSLDLVALATIADVVPLTDTNRILVRQGLSVLSQSKRVGIQALKRVAQVDDHAVTSQHVGFRLGPRINAAGRLDDASVGLQLLLSESPDEAAVLAAKLDSANAERQQIERAILEEAIAQATVAVERGDKGLVLWAMHWHPGVVGIVASRIVERFHRPTVVIGVHDGVGRGSARSIEGIHLAETLDACKEFLLKSGGHKAAAGLSIEPAKIAAFAARFAKVCAERLDGVTLEGRCRIDAAVEPTELTETAVQSLQLLAPFGMGNAEPVLALLNQHVTPRVLANKTPHEPGHLKLTLPSAPAVDVIGFRLAEFEPLTAAPVDLAFAAGIDEFRGVRRVSLKLKDLRAAASE
jgi:single-stranded-DNA-specific exonuclease